MSYSSVLRNLGYSTFLVDAHEGRIQVPEFTLTAPFEPSYGFPPCLIPLWSNEYWPGYIGIVPDWFGVGADSFVGFYVGEQYFSELALSEEQLKIWLAFDFFCNVPDEDEVGDFAELVGLCGKEDVEEYFQDVESKNDLGKLPAFSIKKPQFLVAGGNRSQPLWVQQPSTKENIIALLEKGRALEAWYALNGSKMIKEEKIIMLERLVPLVGNPQFQEMVQCWKGMGG